MLKIKICAFILERSNKFLFLASGVKQGEGFWFIGVKNCDENILTDKKFLDCHRKELIGDQSAKDILYAINLNLENLYDEFKKNSFLVDKPSIGFSFNIPLDVMENIFDFWLNAYKEKNSWETCLGLLKIRKRVSLLNLIKSRGLKGNSMKYALEIEKLHSYLPNSSDNNLIFEPMWK